MTFTALMPDMDHYKGSFGGRVFPLWRDAHAREPNVKPALLDVLAGHYGHTVSAEDVAAYIAALAAHPAYVARFEDDLVQPGLRIPFTADGGLFEEAVALGREVVWLHGFGERFVDAAAGRPAGPPRLPAGTGPTIPREGAIPTDPADMPDRIDYDAERRRLIVGKGFVDNVPPEVWAYEVSGKQVLVQWFSYRRRNRARPLIGDRRPPSPLNDIQPDHWLAEYTEELINVLHVLAWLVRLEPPQADLLERICAGPLLTAEALRTEGAFDAPQAGRRAPTDERQTDLLD